MKRLLVFAGLGLFACIGGTLAADVVTKFDGEYLGRFKSKSGGDCDDSEPTMKIVKGQISLGMYDSANNRKRFLSFKGSVQQDGRLSASAISSTANSNATTLSGKIVDDTVTAVAENSRCTYEVVMKKK